MIARRKRGSKRAPRGRFELQDRDRDLLEWIGRAGVVLLPQVAKIFWGEGHAARTLAARRLRILGDHGLVTTSTVSLHRPNRLSLTAKGAQFVRHGRDGTVLRTRVRASSLAADHLLMVAEVWTCLALRLSEPGPLRLLRFISEGELRHALPCGRRGALVPDGVAVLGNEAERVAVALEVDLGEEPAFVFGKKMERYARHLAGSPFHGLPLDALLVYAPGLARLRRLGRLVPVAARVKVFLQDLDHLGPGTVLEGLATAEGLEADHATSPVAFGASLLPCAA